MNDEVQPIPSEFATTARFFERVIGFDDRAPVPDPRALPWRAIVPLVITAANRQRYTGTGWLIGAHAVVTAGHCVYMHEDGGWPVAVDVHDGNGGVRARGVAYRTVRGWREERDDAADLGLVVIDHALGAEVGWLGFAAFTDSELQQSELVVSGYPSDLGADLQYWHARRAQSVDPRWIHYDTDTTPGQSGSPVLAAVGGQFIAAGIHTIGAARSNQAVRITADVMDVLRRWRALNP